MTLPQVKNPQELAASWIRCQLESGAEMERPEEEEQKKEVKHTNRNHMRRRELKIKVGSECWTMKVYHSLVY